MERHLRRYKIALTGVVVCALLLYFPVVGFDFLQVDDAGYLLNPVVAGGVSWDGVIWAFSTVEFHQWMPVTMLSLMLDVELFGLESASGWHLVNVVIHTANCLLLAAALRGLSMPPWQRLIAVALFALHPMHVEVVAWVVERKELLAMSFGLMSWIAFQRWRQHREYAVYALSCLAFLACLASKPMWVTWPVVLWLLDWSVTGFRWRSLAASVIDKLPLFVISAAISLVTLYAVAPWMLATAERPMMANSEISVLAAYGYYLEKSFWPFGLSTFMELWPSSATLQDAVVGAFLLMLGTAVAIYGSRRHPLVLVGWLWFVITLVPVSGLFQAGHQWVADRYSYFPHVGLILSLTILIGELVKKCPKLVPIGSVLAVMSLAGLAWGASIQLPHWRDTERYWQRAVDITGGGPVTHLYFGDYYDLFRRSSDALVHYEEANRLAAANGYLLKPAIQKSAYTALRLGDTKLGRERTEMLLEYGLLKTEPAVSTALGLELRASGEYALAKRVLAALLAHQGTQESRWLTAAWMGLIATNIDLGQLKVADEQLAVAMATVPRFQSEACATLKAGGGLAPKNRRLTQFELMLVVACRTH